MMKANWIIVVEPNELMRQGLFSVLSNSAHANCAAFETIEEMETNIDPEARDAIFLVNLGREDGIVKRGIRMLKSRHQTSTVVLLSKTFSRSHFHNAIKAGASGYVLTSTCCDAIVKSLEVISFGLPIIPDEALDFVDDDEIRTVSDEPPCKARQSTLPPGLLSDRELLVLRCLSSAMSNKLIARECNICEATVKVHVKAILRKIKGKNRTEAAIWALDQGLEPYQPATHLCRSRTNIISDVNRNALGQSISLHNGD
ncbi:MAG: LuxR C-terminal-related transcriptional regulator [Hyphomicrobiaceae bacterium]